MWNSGIFIWNVNSIIDAFKKYLPDIIHKFNEGKELFNTPAEKKFIDTSFPFCPNISIDYGILEKANNVYVNISNFGWSDLGTWGRCMTYLNVIAITTPSLTAKHCLWKAATIL